jgi:arylsulfatase A-like enzyme
MGCYGNEWIETPHLDRLATSAVVYDSSFADSVGPRSRQAWVTGQHSQRRVLTRAPLLGDHLRQAQVTSHLLTAETELSPAWTPAGFDQTQVVRGHEGLAAAPNEVPIARLVSAASSVLKNTPADKRLLWLHAPEPGLPPEGFASLYFEDFAERGVDVAAMDREQWRNQSAVAAGAMSLVDHWIGELLQLIDTTSDGQPTLILIASARGRSWIEDFIQASPTGHKSTPATVLRDQELKTPLFLQLKHDERSSDFTGLRCQRFSQPVDLLTTLLNWFSVPQAAVAVSADGQDLIDEALSLGAARNFICSGDDDLNFSIRTDNWGCLFKLATANQAISESVQFGDSDWPEQVQLFSKPEDIWDITDLASQFPEECESFVRRWIGFRAGR